MAGAQSAEQPQPRSPAQEPDGRRDTGSLAGTGPRTFTKPTLRREQGWLVLEPVEVGLISGLNVRASRTIVAACLHYPGEVYVERLTATGDGEVLDVFQRYKGVLQQQGIQDVARARQFLQGFRANGKHLIALTMLAARWGVQLRIAVQGVDAEAQALIERLRAQIASDDQLPELRRLGSPTEGR